MKIYFDKQFYLKYWQQNKLIIIFSMIMAIFSFGYTLFNFTLSIDEEIESFQKASESYVYLTVGRWGIFLLNQALAPSSILPYFPTLIALIGIAASSILFLSSQSDGLTAKLIFSIIFITNPIHSYYIAFNTTGLYYAIGMSLTTLSFLSLKIALETNKRNWKNYLFSILLLGFSISLYQALLAFFLVFAAYSLLLNQINSSSVVFKKTLKEVFVITLVVFSAFVFYKIGDISARYFLFEGKYFHNSEYLEKFISWGKMPVKETLLKLFLNQGGYLLGMKNFGNVFYLVSKSLIVLIPVLIYFIFKSTISSKTKVISYVLLGFLMISPFIINYINGIPVPTRALMSLAMMMAMIWLLVYRLGGSLIRKIMLIAAILIFINNTYINTRLFYSGYVSWQADRDMANRIIERVYNLNPPVKNNQILVAFVGFYQHPTNELFVKSDIFGLSFFGMDGGNPWRIMKFFKTLGINDMQIVLYEKLTSMKTKIDEMPVWPAKDAVKLIDKIVIVKLSDPVNKKNEKHKAKLTFQQEFTHLPDSLFHFNPPKSEFNTNYAIDVINDIFISSATENIIISKENITIKGWAVDSPSLQPAFAVYLDINHKLYRAEYGKPRPDVVKAYKNNNYQSVGWELKLKKGELKKGKFKMRIVIIGNGRNTYFVPEQTVEFEVR